MMVLSFTMYVIYIYIYIYIYFYLYNLIWVKHWNNGNDMAMHLNPGTLGTQSHSWSMYGYSPKYGNKKGFDMF